MIEQKYLSLCFLSTALSHILNLINYSQYFNIIKYFFSSFIASFHYTLLLKTRFTSKLMKKNEILRMLLLSIEMIYISLNVAYSHKYIKLNF